MKTFDDLVAEASIHITELMPWDLADKIEQQKDLLVIDVREADEFNAMHISDSINIPRGILEAASEQGYDESNPDLYNARDREVVVICRSGKRSCLAAYTLHQLGFKNATSLKTGLRGWNDFEQRLIDENNNEVDGDQAEQYLQPKTNQPSENNI